MKTDTREQQLLDQQLALSAYLDALLDEPVRAPVAETVPITAPVQTPVVVEEEPVVPEASATLAVAPAAEGLPDWATSRFQALLFEVAGLTLAVPLVKLKGVVPNDQGCTPMPGHSSLFLGVVPYQGLQSKVVDTASFVLPADRAAQLSEDASERMQQLVMIDNGRWALACNRIGDVIDLNSDDVKWRGSNSKRQWLAGTVIERMCALLDIDQLALQLAEGMA
jgi:purine-binding chemotaxis protein CheW